MRTVEPSQFAMCVTSLRAVPEPDTSGAGIEPNRTWRLVIPETFLYRLLTESLDGLIAFCRREGRDPQAHLNRPLWV